LRGDSGAPEKKRQLIGFRMAGGIY